MMLPDYDRNVLTCAYHEAGHAVAMALIGLPVASAEVSARGGQVILDFADMPPRLHIDLSKSSRIWKESALLYAATFYAGWQAELLLHAFRLEGCLPIADLDHQHAADILRNSFGDDIPIYPTQKLARAILWRYWSTVEILAMKLKECGFLTRSEIEAVLPSVKPHPADLLGLVSLEDFF